MLLQWNSELPCHLDSPLVEGRTPESQQDQAYLSSSVWSAHSLSSSSFENTHMHIYTYCVNESCPGCQYGINFSFEVFLLKINLIFFTLLPLYEKLLTNCWRSLYLHVTLSEARKSSEMQIYFTRCNLNAACGQVTHQHFYGIWYTA